VKRPQLLKRVNFALTNVAWILPAFVLYVVLVISPGFLSIIYSLTNWNGLAPEFGFVGFANFIDLFRDDVFLLSLRNNVVYLFFNGLVQNSIALIYALILNERFRGYKAYRTIIFFPFVITPVGVGIAFIYMLHPVYGVLKSLFTLLGMSRLSVNLLGNPATVVPTIGLVQVWLSMGVMVMVWLAGIQNLDRELIEAARIDGANNRQLLFRVITPLLTPSIIVVTVLTIVGNFKAYDLPWSMTAGGPGYASYFASIFIYKTAFEYYRFGYAMAASAVIFVLPLTLIGISIVVIRRWFYTE
jgi:raffinose/stachyose/melibiose transport system permease protein